MLKNLFITLTTMLFIGALSATPVDTYEFKSVANQKRALALAEQLRCPQCQNQNLIDSNSPVAKDLRIVVYQMVDENKSDEEIIDFMTLRYGEFVKYKPKVDSSTAILWYGPFAILILGLLVVITLVRKNKQRTGEQQAQIDSQAIAKALQESNNKK